MIARFRLLLPYRLIRATGQALTPLEFDASGYKVRVYSPYSSKVDYSIFAPGSKEPPSKALEQMMPDQPEDPDPDILLDDRPSVEADTLQIDFSKESFDRGPDWDPPRELIFEVANDVLGRLRTLGGAPQIRPVQMDSGPWVLEYLNDDESELAPQPPLLRRRYAVPVTFSTFALRAGLWEAARSLAPPFNAGPWDALLLDALDLLAEAHVGPSIVLAIAAIETRIAAALEILAGAKGLDPDFWQWIRDRGHDYRKEPSISEQLDQLLKGLSQKSLKDDGRLWERFRNLYEARNTYVHEGVSKIGRSSVDRTRAAELVAAAGDVIQWIEQLLPEEHRTPRYVPGEGERVVVTKILLHAPDEPGSRLPEGAAPPEAG